MRAVKTSLFWNEEDIPRRFVLPAPVNSRRYLIGGQIRSWTGKTAPVQSPIYVRKSGRFLRKNIGAYPLLGGREALAALRTAKSAFDGGNGAWPSLTIAERAEAVRRFMSHLVRKKRDIIRLLMWEIAKPYKELEDEFARTLDFVEQVTNRALEKGKYYRTVAHEKGILGIARDEPLGVALCMGPYNYPLFETFSLLFPALLMGNTIIVKPPRFGVLFFDYLLEDFAASFPAGAVNCLFGDGPAIIEPLMESGQVDVLAFIGSARTANRLINLHPRKNRLKSLLGLGAKNVAVVFPDADLETTVRESILGALAFNGQRCAALKMFFVHEDYLELFLEALDKELEKIKIGMPWEEGVRITPLADVERVGYLERIVADAVGLGAKIINAGGGRPFKSVYYPTILCPVGRQMRIYHEEQFGPVLPVVPFNNIKAPADYVVKSPFGQQASIFGGEVGEIRSLVNLIKNQVSRININAKCQRGPDVFPFAGRKDSAKGDFSVPGILDAFSAKSILAARENPWSKRLFRKLGKQQGVNGKEQGVKRKN
jgi:glyceraldehyde-3-phosphate dehydrogenase (NADP+)